MNINNNIPTCCCLMVAYIGVSKNGKHSSFLPKSTEIQLHFYMPPIFIMSFKFIKLNPLNYISIVQKTTCQDQIKFTSDDYFQMYKTLQLLQAKLH